MNPILPTLGPMPMLELSERIQERDPDEMREEIQREEGGDLRERGEEDGQSSSPAWHTQTEAGVWA